jgi:hypothetical protein
MLTSTDVRLWFWRFVRVAVAVVLGAACFNVFVTAIYKRYQPDYRHEGDPFLLSRSNTNVNLDLSGDQFWGSIRVSLSRADVLRMQRALAIRGNASFLQVVRPYLPDIDVGRGGDGFALDRVTFDVPAGTGDGSMRVTLRPLPIDSQTSEIRIRIAPSAQIEENYVYTHIDTTSVSVLAVNVSPREQSQKATAFETRGSDILQLRVVRDIPREKPSARIADVVQRFDSRYLYVIDPLIGGVMYSVPFLLLIALRRRLTGEQVPTSGGFAAASTVMVVFFIGLGLLRAAGDIYQDPVQGLRELLLRPCEPVFLYVDGAAALGAAFVACYWPVYAIRKREEHRIASPATRITLWLAFLASAVVTVIATFESCVGIRSGDAMSDATRQTFNLIRGTFGDMPKEISLIAAAAATIFALAAITAELTTGFRAIAAAIGTALSASALELFNALFDHSHIEALIIIAVLAAPMVFAILKIIVPAWPARTLFIVSIMVAALLALRPMPNDNIWWEPTVSYLAGNLAPALRLIAAWFLIRILHDLSETGRWDLLEDGERDAGIILALTFLFMPSHQWLYITVSIVLGWVVLRHWIFVPRTIPRESDTDAPRTIRDVIRLNEASSALSAMKKEMRGKLAKGEVPFHEYERHVRGLEAFVDDLRTNLHPGGDDAPAVVLSSGQPAPPWTRAIIGARYGLLLSVPWIALFLRNFHLRFAPHTGSEWVGALGTAVQVMGQWPLLGFLFGYFYPHLRGETGLSKALYLYLAVAAPALAATALAIPTSSPAWTSLFFWALQLLIHCMLLGLFAGDYETLRKAGLGWRQVLAVHNLDALAAWGSTLLLAIGAAATTYITSNGGAFLMQMLQNAPELTR